MIAGAVGSAGARGAYLAGLLALGGFPVTLWTQGTPLTELRAHGLTLTDHAGMAQAVQNPAHAKQMKRTRRAVLPGPTSC